MRRACYSGANLAPGSGGKDLDMKRLHVNLAVKHLDQSVCFYSTLFAAEPTVLKPDYAKWILEDPRVNFAISTRGAAHGLDHLGIQVDSREELAELAGRLESAGTTVHDKGEAHCCYARSDKAWVRDPEGLAWESFFTFGSETLYGEDLAITAPAPKIEARAEASTEPAGTLRRACCGKDAA
jgi:catechol 2,3-dioxygenase-like lactoylglutathione lyase family enzyme